MYTKEVYTLGMTIQLPTEAQAFIKQQMATGHYADESEVLTQALALWQRQQMEQIAKIQEGYAEGKADLEAGRSTTITTPEEAEAHRAKIIERGKAKLARLQHSAH